MRFQKYYQTTDDAGAGGTGGQNNEAAEALKKAAFERDNARAAEAKLRKEIEEIKKALPSDEQKARWADLEKQQETAEEERKRKAGEFDQWRKQLEEKKEHELKARDKQREEAEQKAEKFNQELNTTLIGLQFAAATALFGPQGKTVLPPDIAQSFFANRVKVDVDDKTGNRSVIVKDTNGTPILDPKTGQPMEFAKAMAEVIDNYPAKELILRGSGKVGSGSAGGGHGSASQIDLGRLKPSDFNDPKVREAVKRQHADAGGMVFGPTLQKLAERK